MPADQTPTTSRAEAPARVRPGFALHFVLGLLLIGAAFLAYAPALRGGFVWDDDAHITKPELRSLAGLGRIWFELGASQQYYPILHSAFWLEHRWWGDAPVGYHMINVLLHLAAAFLLVLILRQLKLPGGWLAAFLFALHPVHVESVAWITEQKNVLSAGFYLSSALSYLRFHETRRTRFYWLALALFAGALLTKSVTATLPAALLVILWWQQGTLAWRRDVAPLLPWIFLGAGMGLFTAWVERKFVGAEGVEFALTLLQRGLLAGRVAWFYAGKLVWPVELSFSYPRWEIDPTAIGAYLFPVAMVAAMIAAWWLRHSTRAPLAVVLFFGGTLFPVLGFFNVYPFRYSYVADHFQYLASLAFIVPASALATHYFSFGGRPFGRWGATALLVGVLAALTARQASNYRDSLHLYESVLARNPNSWMAHSNIGIDLEKAGQPEAAYAHFTTALRLNPKATGARNNLGHLLLDQGKPAEAIPYFQQALEIDPGFFEARINLSTALRLTGQGRAALRQAMLALDRSPDSPAALVCVGAAWQTIGQLDRAIVHYQRALASDPNHLEAHLNLGLALLARGNLAASMAHSRAALRLDPKSGAAHNNLGNALQAADKLPAAAAEFQAALALQPDYPEAHQNLAIVLRRTGQTAQAITHAKRALQLLPQTPEVRINLALSLLDAGRVDEARQQWAEAKKLRPNLPAMPEPLPATPAKP